MSVPHRCTQWVDASSLEDETNQKAPADYEAAWETVRKAHGILVPGGFGSRGIEGKILAANYARTNRKPYLGARSQLQINEKAVPGLIWNASSPLLARRYQASAWASRSPWSSLPATCWA